MSHGVDGLYHGVFYGIVVLVFFGGLWRWRQWYVGTADAARARRSLWLAWSAALVFSAGWLACGRASMGITGLRWAVPPLAAAGALGFALGLGRRT